MCATSSATASGDAIPSVSTTTTSLRTRLDRRRVDRVVEVALGAGGVDAEERRVDVVLGGEAHGIRDAAEHLLPAHADRVELQVRDRRLDHRVRDTELDERLEVGGHRAREAPDLRAEPCGGDLLDRLPVVVGDAREASFDAVDAERVEQLCDLELLVGIEHDPDGLLAVAQRRVVETDPAADRVRVVQRAGPDQLFPLPAPAKPAPSLLPGSVEPTPADMSPPRRGTARASRRRPP